MDDKQKNLKDLQQVFKSDISIKNALFEASPNSNDSYDNDSRIKYSDKAYELMKEMKSDFSDILNTFDMGGDFKKSVLDKINEIEKNFFEDVYKGDLRKTYLKHFANMDEKIVKGVNEKCIGYTFNYAFDIIPLVEQCKTYNELLHILHSHVVNNEDILRSLPVIATKESDFIKVYGIESEMAMQIFDSFQSGTPVGETTIVSLGDDRTIMMVRDMGHALTLDIAKEDDGVYVDYFVPKICNPKKVNELRGVVKVKEDANSYDFTKGNFKIEQLDEIGQEVVQFVESVPTDFDIDLTKFDHRVEEEKLPETDTKTNQERHFEADDYKEVAEKQKSSELVNFIKKFKEKLFGGLER